MTRYFLGIGGIGMSALARYYMAMGDTVYGYDRTRTELTEALEREGAIIHYDDNPQQLPQHVDMVIYTPAVPTSLAEFKAIKLAHIPMVKRAEALAEIANAKKCVAVAGSHGKTSTSTMVAHLLTNSEVGCSAILGGISKDFESNLHLQQDTDWMVTEADEYDHSFLHLKPHVSIITSTDDDHLDIYGTHEELINAYMEFGRNVQPNGMVLLGERCFLQPTGEKDSPDQLRKLLGVHTAVYAVENRKADYYAHSIKIKDGKITFTLHTPATEIKGLELQGTAYYNLENAVAASAAALAAGVSHSNLRKGLKTYSGVRRRFDFRILRPSFAMIDDYAHHPAEIKSTLESVRKLFPNQQVLGIFQPHLYSRTRDFSTLFAQVLSEFDEVVLLPIYPAREKPIKGISSEIIFDQITNPKKHLCSKEDALKLIPTLQADVVVTLGAGDIDHLVPKLEAKLKKQSK